MCATYGMTEKWSCTTFRIYKKRCDYYTLSIPGGFGEITNIIWQGAHLHVRTDEGVLFIFSDFYTYERI